MSNNRISLAERAVVTLAEVARIGIDMTTDDPRRYAIYKMKMAAEKAIEEGFTVAAEIADAARAVLRETVGKEQNKP